MYLGITALVVDGIHDGILPSLPPFRTLALVFAAVAVCAWLLFGDQRKPATPHRNQQLQQPPLRPLTCYARIWAVSTLVRIYTQTGRGDPLTPCWRRVGAAPQATLVALAHALSQPH